MDELKKWAMDNSITLVSLIGMFFVLFYRMRQAEKWQDKHEEKHTREEEHDEKLKDIDTEFRKEVRDGFKEVRKDIGDLGERWGRTDEQIKNFRKDYNNGHK